MSQWNKLAILIFPSVVACSHHDKVAPIADTSARTTHEEQRGEPVHHRFVVRHFVGAESNPTQEVGVIDVDANDMLVIERAEGPTASKLREAVATINNANSVPADGLDGTKVDRGQPGFFHGEREHLRKYYGFELTPM